jgi:hypothetical protein
MSDISISTQTDLLAGTNALERFDAESIDGGVDALQSLAELQNSQVASGQDIDESFLKTEINNQSDLFNASALENSLRPE